MTVGEQTKKPAVNSVVAVIFSYLLSFDSSLKSGTFNNRELPQFFLP
jgi:hypothetical protein